MLNVSKGCAAAALALLPLAAVALPVEYRGAVAATPFIGGQPVINGATTVAPANYVAASGGGSGVSTSMSANGGSVESTIQTSIGQANADTRIIYYPRLIGPAGPPLQVRVIASGFAEGFGLASNSTANFVVNALAGQLLGLVTHNGNELKRSFFIDTLFLIYPNEEFQVGLEASATGGDLNGIQPNFAHAFVDPQFIIAPAFASLYHFEGIPGAPVPAGIPEPSSWALMLLGLGLIGKSAATRGKARPSVNQT